MLTSVHRKLDKPLAQSRIFEKGGKKSDYSISKNGVKTSCVF